MQEINKYLAPQSIEAAAQAMADGTATVFCGGTDLTPQTDSGARQYGSSLVNLRRVAGLAGISEEADSVRIGAATTVTEVRESALLARLAPLLVEAASHFASDQIRNAASIGGNVCNASPAGDMINPLLVLDAEAELVSWQNGALAQRRVPLAGFFTAPGKSVKAANELLTALRFKKPAAGFVGRFRKAGPRPALEISTVSLGIGGRLENGVFSDVRVALGSVAPTPLRARRVEAALEGKPLDAASISAAVAAAAIDATPIDDVRASAWYRTHLVKAFTEEVLNHVRGN